MFPLDYKDVKIEIIIIDTNIVIDILKGRIKIKIIAVKIQRMVVIN